MRNNAGSSNGRTPDSGSGNPGSSPGPAVFLLQEMRSLVSLGTIPTPLNGVGIDFWLTVGQNGRDRKYNCLGGIIHSMQGIFSIYKPKGPTSHDIIYQLRKITGIKRIGHAGTLDPLASGVLVVGIGREATKKLGEVVKKEKEYIATIRLGEESTTDDAEGEKKKFAVNNTPSREAVQKAVDGFVGEIMQQPPVYSSVKVQGKPAHRRVRKGEMVNLGLRNVFIKEIEILLFEWPSLKLRVVTGPGVYIRSLARDIGRELQVGGYLSDLERVRVGEFVKEKALTVNQFGNFFNK